MDIAADLDFVVGAPLEISRPAFVAAYGGSLNSYTDRLEPFDQSSRDDA